MKVIDLFAGCGGMSLGFENAGFKVEAAFDNWKPAIEVYSKNFSHPIFNVDLSAENVLSHFSKYSPDVVIGGPPCQDFSIAGHNNTDSKRANLTINFANIVTSIMPEWFVMENVYNIEKSAVLPKVKDIFTSAGYGLTSYILDASYVGVPQARKRYFLIGHISSEDNFLSNDLVENLNEKQTTVYDYLKGKLDLEYYYMHPRSYARRAVFSIHEPSSTIRGTNRPVPLTYKRHPADKADISEGVRALTTKERSYLQTFPENFKLEGSKSQLEQVIGNAVPVKMAEYIALCIKNYKTAD
ncbi:MAG: DNA (cytosine-5-)-methyltransferase [Arcobacter sp.]|nr:DNA (cytosine-5-)-methyltransferase [Arcobacter sp.]